MQQVDHITVLKLGKIDHRPAFHTSVQIFPIGYKCEQKISGVSIQKGAMNQVITCEIEDLEGYPQFRITVKATGDTYMASSESSVWKKVYYSWWLYYDIACVLSSFPYCSLIPAILIRIGTRLSSVSI